AVLTVMLSVCAFAAEKTVYLSNSGDNANSGASFAEAVKTIDQAYKLIGSDNGRIIVCNNVKLGDSYVMPKHDGTVTITANDGKNFYSFGKLTISSLLSLSGDTVFENVGLNAPKSTAIVASGNNLTIGKNVTTSGSISISGGHNATAESTAEEVSIANDYTITVKSGEFTYLRGGNRRAVGEAPFGTISGNITVNIEGGKFTYNFSKSDAVSATGMNNQTGNATLNISGGIIAGNVYGVTRSGTNAVNASPVVSGNVTVNITGGTIGGKYVKENQDGSIALTGKFHLNLVECIFSNIEEISGSATSTITVSESLKKGGIKASTYTNPITKAPDPWVIQRDGFYYSVFVLGTRIVCVKSATIDGLAYAEEVTIWSAPKDSEINASNKHYSKEIWSPELHYIEASEFGAEYAGWWLYFAADDGENANHRLFAVRALTDDAQGQYGSPVTGEVNVPAKMVVDGDKSWAIGQSLVRVNGKTYMTWTSEVGRNVIENGDNMHKQQIRITALANPYTPTGKWTLVAEADPALKFETYGAWKYDDGSTVPYVIEGATAIYDDNGNVVITYSASGYWTPRYCLSYLTLKAGADPLDEGAWIKLGEPVFTMQNGVFGPGHAAFTTDAKGNRIMMYHAYVNYKCEDNGRYVFIQPWSFENGVVDMNGGPYSTDTEFTVYNTYAPITNVVKGFAK
ncbi:MAG: family 43 glycosylhydrolase, partial [Clostridia bacterium]|nr:family 43 glycosylhydrolase [Clostridia bacterium]